MEPSFKAGSPPLRLRRIMIHQTRNTRRAEGPLQQAMAARAAHHEPRNKGFHRPFRLHEHDPRSTIHCLSTRNTNHGFFSNHGLFSSHRLDSLPGIAHDCPALPTIARLPRRQSSARRTVATGSSASWMQRLPAQASLSREQEPPPANTAREPRPNRHPGFWVTNHETRITKHGFSHGLSPNSPCQKSRGRRGGLLRLLGAE